MIPYGRQNIDQTDIDAVVSVLKSDFLTQGPAVPLFEATVKNLCQSEFALAMNSATSALHVACLALEVGAGDYVWTTPLTFVASSNCALYCGAQVDFVDVDEKTYNLCPQKLEEKLAQAQKENKLPKVVIPVHLSGLSCDMESIFKLSKKYGFKIIEDASHAIGGHYKNRPIGCCEFSDIAIFSFHPVKIITTAEGGMALTNSEVLAKKMELYRSHGITRDENLMESTSHGPWYYEQIELGYNYRMTELQAALGLNQLKRLSQFIDKRHELASRYHEKLADLPLKRPTFQSDDHYSALHLYIIRLELGQITKSHRQIFELLREKGIGVNLHYIPVYLQPYYKKLGFKVGHCPQAEQYYKEAISVPLYYDLNHQKQDTVIQALKELLT